MRFALFGNTHETNKSAHAELLLRILSHYADEVYADPDFYRFLREEQPFPFEPAGIISDLASQGIDMAISLGGDGTFLKAARCIGDTGIPIVGINTGRLGFLVACCASLQATHPTAPSMPSTRLPYRSTTALRCLPSTQP